MSISIVRSHRSPAPPIPLSPLIGRQAEIAAAIEFLGRADVRLLSLIGPGGVGKTRLGIRVSADISDAFSDGVVYVPLAAIRDAHLVAFAIAEAIDLRVDTEGAADRQVTEAFERRECLLLLDNFEQVLDAAPLVGHILAVSPRSKALVTSRAPLDLNGEQQLRLLPLSLPAAESIDPDAIRETDAVALFVQRARAIRPDFQITQDNAATVADICRRLDGLPLAIELAAARLNILSPHALLARLDNRLHVLTGSRADVPERLRTMSAAMAWSYDLLPESTKNLLCLISVFTGRFDLAAIEAVTPSKSGVSLDDLSRLVDHSLVQQIDADSTDPRFAMLETIREFALDKLRERGEEWQVRRAYTAYYRSLAGDAKRDLTGQAQQDWLQRLDFERDNIRAAMDWSLQNGEVSTALGIAGDIWRYWYIRGSINEGRDWLRRGLESSTDLAGPERVGAPIAAAQLAGEQSDHEFAERSFREALDLAVESKDWNQAAAASSGLGTTLQDRGEYAGARVAHERTLGFAEEAADRRAEAVAYGNLGVLAYYHGDLDQAEAMWTRSRAITIELGDRQSSAMLASNLGGLAQTRGNYEAAEELLTEALAIQRELGNDKSMAITLVSLGDVRLSRGEIDGAEVQVRAAIELFQEIDDIRSVALARARLAKIAELRGDLSGATRMLQEASGVLFQSGDRLSFLEVTEELAQILIKRGHAAQTVRLLSATRSLRGQIDAPMREDVEQTLDGVLHGARAMIGDATFGRERVAGEALSFDALSREIVSLLPHGLVDSPVLSEAPKVAKKREQPLLSEREQEVLRLVAAGYPGREIADALFISPRTASTHVTNILNKLGVGTRSAAVAQAMRLGLL